MQCVTVCCCLISASPFLRRFLRPIAISYSSLTLFVDIVPVLPLSFTIAQRRRPSPKIFLTDESDSNAIFVAVPYGNGFAHPCGAVASGVAYLMFCTLKRTSVFLFSFMGLITSVIQSIFDCREYLRRGCVKAFAYKPVMLCVFAVFQHLR